MKNRPLLYATLILMFALGCLLASPSCSNGQDVNPQASFNQTRQNLLDEAYYVSSLEVGFYAIVAKHKLQKASELLVEKDPELAKKLAKLAKELPAKQNCYDGKKTLMPNPDKNGNKITVASYLRKLSGKKALQEQETQCDYLHLAAKNFDLYDAGFGALCRLENQICNNSGSSISIEALKKELEGKKAAFGALLHEEVTFFNKFARNWSSEKALSLTVQMNQFNWTEFEAKMAENSLLWWLEASEIFGKRNAKSMLMWYQLYRIHAQSCPEFYQGDEIANSKQKSDELAKRYASSIKSIENAIDEATSLRKAKCRREATKKKSKVVKKRVPRPVEQNLTQQSFAPAPLTVPNVVQNPSNWVPGILVQPNWSQPKWTVPSFVPPQSTVIQSTPSTVAPKKAFW